MSIGLKIEDLEKSLETKRIGRRIIYEEVLDSTNSYALSLGEKGLEEGTCIICDHQRAGRGRRGRSWFSPKGKNIYMSLILRPEIPLESLSAITFLSSLSVYYLLKESLSLPAALKWPNDVLVRAKKISGSLIELPKGLGRPDFLVVGIGLNVNMREEDLPDELKDKATSLRIEKGVDFERLGLIKEILEKFERYYFLLLSEGPLEIIRIWEKEAEILGKRIRVRDDERVIEGKCLGLNKMGAIVLDLGGRLEIINAGDVEVDAPRT